MALSSLTALALGSACSAPNSAAPDGDGDAGGDGDGDDDINIGDGDGDGDSNIDLPPTPGCGDGVLTQDEACDDGNLMDGDGCFGNCRGVEKGYICRAAGEECEQYAKCGDGIKSFPELCDDGNATADDGCSEFCKVEIGFKCDDASPSACTTTTCGDGEQEGAELCDDGNALPFDGCSLHCQIEPECAVGAGCTSTCGDGIVLGEEGCDDANNIDDDGCSATCQPEEGYTCMGEPCEMINGECVLRVPAIFRDFPASNPDFGYYQGNGGDAAAVGSNTGMVAATLDAEGKPVPASPGAVTTLASWYRDGEGGNSGPNVSEIILFGDESGTFVNRYQDDGTQWQVPNGAPNCQPQHNPPCFVDGNPLFFPVDDIANPADAARSDANVPQPMYGGSGLPPDPDHNFHFTTEVSYWFIYDPAANARLTFVGDDDVWVFLNGTLAVDIGNKHEPKGGRIQLGATNATIEYSTDQAFETWTGSTRPISDFGLTAGNVYEIKVFHAERETLSSSFQLTLAGFDASRSLCQPFCGDGVIGVGEECDDGMNDGGYNECQPECVLGGYCGDGVKQEDEQCDDNDPAAPGNCQGCRIIVVQ